MSENLYEPLDPEIHLKPFSQKSFILHPLPLLNISDYYTRSKSTETPSKYYRSRSFFLFFIFTDIAKYLLVIGGLMGTRNYKEVTAFIAFELLLEDGLPDENYLKSKLNLCM